MDSLSLYFLIMFYELHSNQQGHHHYDACESKSLIKKGCHSWFLWLDQ
jgi:hypothetical protein